MIHGIGWENQKGHSHYLHNLDEDILATSWLKNFYFIENYPSQVRVYDTYAYCTPSKHTRFGNCGPQL